MRTFILVILLTIPLFAQELDDKFVEEVIFSGNGIFLMVDNGYLRINQNDSYEEYYRKIYNDSTITNPNTVITNDINLNFIPFINLSQYSKSHKLNNPQNLGIFLNIGGSTGYSLTPFAQSLIDSLKNNK